MQYTRHPTGGSTSHTLLAAVKVRQQQQQQQCNSWVLAVFCVSRSVLWASARECSVSVQQATAKEEENKIKRNVAASEKANVAPSRP